MPQRTPEHVPPPPSVWEEIAARTGVDASPRPEIVASPLLPAPEPPAVLPPRRPRRRRRPRGLLAAAGAVLAAGLGAVALAAHGEATVLARATLAPLDSTAVSGTARVVDEDGDRMLQIRLRAPAPGADGFYEVWLTDPALQGMHPVGVAHDGTTDLRLPDGLDPARFPVVDVSVEPLDRGPSHSGVSVARGVLAG